MARAKKYWLMKCEPAAYTIDDLARDGVTGWEGVRNYQARNYMRDEMRPGDGVLFYASNAEPSGVVGLAEISGEGYPDPFAFKKGHRYHDEKSSKDDPTWYTVDIRFIEKFAAVVPLDELRAQRALAGMMVLQKGSRLSIQPVSRAHFDAVVALGRARLPLATGAPSSGEATTRATGRPAARKPAASKTAVRKAKASKAAASKPAGREAKASKPAGREAIRRAK